MFGRCVPRVCCQAQALDERLPTRSLQPTPDGALSSAFAVHVIGPAWLSSVVSQKNMKTHEVFGIAPTMRKDSYVDRGSLDETVESLLARTIHIAVRGPSKCGKSWLRQKSLSNSLTVQCRHNKPFTDIYVDALSQLNIRTEIQKSETGAFKATLTATGEASAFLLAKASVSSGIAKETGDAVQTKYIGHDVSDLRFVAELIKASERRLVIEDFHYMKIDDRRAFAFDLKALWDYGLFVVMVGVWSESNLLLFLNTDLTGRVYEISVAWSNDDLKQIITNGGHALNIDVDDSVKDHLAALAYSNAGILQQLTLYSLDEAKIREKKFLKQRFSDVKFVDSATMFYADQLNPVYQQFAKRVSAGIRTRSKATGIYAHAIAVILAASDDELIRGLHARTIFQRASQRQSRIQYSNLKAILEKIESLQIDSEGRGLVISYNEVAEEVSIVDRQLLLYRRYATIKWPWEDIIAEAEAQGGQVEAG